MGRQVQSFVAGFVGGALVGAVSALLLAPRSGQEVRQQLRERSKALQEQAQTVAGEVRVRSQDVLTRGKVLIENAAEVASQRVQELGQRTARAATGRWRATAGDDVPGDGAAFGGCAG